MRWDDGWNQIQFNLSDFTRRAYGTNYIETLRVQIHANCRRIYFSDRLYSEEELPPEFKLFLPIVKGSAEETQQQALSDQSSEEVLRNQNAAFVPTVNDSTYTSMGGNFNQENDQRADNTEIQGKLWIKHVLVIDS